MAKLVEILGEKLHMWCDWFGDKPLRQDPFGSVYIRSDKDIDFYSPITFLKEFKQIEIASDYLTAEVTRAQWEAERARIRKEEGYKAMLNDSKDIAEKSIPVSLGFRMEEDVVSEDQALWDKVAIGWITGAAADPATSWFDERLDALITCSCNVADAFMAERAKRIKG